jgi:anti-sigma regulatory factor (Ser/Thr protein kinase)
MLEAIHVTLGCLDGLVTNLTFCNSLFYKDREIFWALGVDPLIALEAERKGLVLTWQVADEVPGQVTGDWLRLQQILTNLIGNAVKFTEQGKVELAVAADDRTTVSFRVTDTGIGIPADKMQFLFQPFSQVDDSMTRHYGGTASARILRRFWAGASPVPARKAEGASSPSRSPLRRQRRRASRRHPSPNRLLLRRWQPFPQGKIVGHGFSWQRMTR